MIRFLCLGLVLLLGLLLPFVAVAATEATRPPEFPRPVDAGVIEGREPGEALAIWPFRRRRGGRGGGGCSGAGCNTEPPAAIA